MTKEEFELKLKTLEKIYKNTEPEILESLKLIISNDFFYTKENLKEKLWKNILFLEENSKAFDNASFDINNSASISTIYEVNDTRKSILSISRDCSFGKITCFKKIIIFFSSLCKPPICSKLILQAGGYFL